jgi:hypothetical protein
VIANLRAERVVDIDLYAIADDWQTAGPTFGMWKM